MSDKTGIEWTRGDDGTPGATWNPVTGCTKVSAGCDHCYAETFAERWRGVPGHHFENGFDVTLRPERLEQPLRWTRPRRIFVNSMSDLFHDAVPDEYIARVFAVMAQAEQHTFQVLTKRHGRMRSLLAGDRLRVAVEDIVQASVRWPLPGVWLGVSVEDQKWAAIRIPALLGTPAAVRFLSCEPLLGPVDLRTIPYRGDRPYWLDVLNGHYRGSERYEWGTDFSFGLASLGRIGWVICGGESGAKARPMHPEWARSLRDQCQPAHVPFLFKQWGAHRWVAGNRYDEETQCWVDDGIVPQRVSKKLAGRELDGRTWDQFPRTAEAGTAP